MLSVTSISGGKSSAYMAVKYPTDRYIFACVLTEQESVAPKDKGLLRECQNRLPQFVASRELDQTLRNVIELEQLLGKRIDWVAGPTFDQLVRQRSMLPNKLMRFCTHEMKLLPIFWHCYLNYMQDDKDIILMNIGFRADEPQRVERMNSRCDKIEFPDRCHVDAKDKRNKQQRRKLEWRVVDFPMYRDGIDRLDVAKFWLDKGWTFPTISNCDGCFFHRLPELREQAELHPERLEWWKQQESLIGSTFLKGATYTDILKNKQLSLFDADPNLACACTD